MAITVLLLLLSAFSLAQTKPLSVCDILRRAADWDNNIVLVRAHAGGGLEDFFLGDDDAQCAIWFAYPDAAAQDDATVNRTFARRRIPVSLKRDSKFADFARSGKRDDKNPTCPGLDLVVTVWGRLDSKQNKSVSKTCPQPFGMCNYRARLVLESVEDVTIGHSKPRCK